MTASARVADAPLPAEAWDERLMAAALSLGRRNLGRTRPNPSVGALIVNTQGDRPIVVGRGFTAIGGRPHAETEALNAAGEAARGATLYVTLEPCAHHSRTPPCADAILAAGIARVVVAMEDPNPRVQGQGIAQLREAGVAITLGIGAAAARIAHAGHTRRFVHGRPHVILKLAVAADGKTGLAGRRPASISCEESRAEAHMLRATSDAVLVGVGTVMADDPRLNCRLPGMSDRSPLRIVLDGGLRIPLQSKLVRTAKEISLWIVARQDAAGEAEAPLKSAGCEVIRVAAGADGKVDLGAALRYLCARGITRLLVEGGPIISAALVKSDLVDEAVIVCSPTPLGADAIPALEGMPLEALVESQKFKLIDRRRVGVDTLLRLFRS
ncbi:MAG: bifunctional diaminohydroxyphosphoribosylaminopyrimidine deaminase/5-amino-6-(5-phosphoribosylamino)uracil reductase RibD [Xanthobacteraceae bacterium]|nr:bifunctional diaminohydroxyphosphoribosylaminopyrimidine deaminase/5-amino-6-(5-phosphoribosylamino)uracil reductase RibD [Xanthobacteraceae bacterium]